jgi:GT2 family glycosyltransferase
MIDLTIVIPSFEAADCLAKCLTSIERAAKAEPDLGLEVIVVDNGSRDGSLDVAERAALRPRLVAWADNRGFASAVNAGLRRRRGRHALLLNSDVEIEPDLLREAVRLLDRSPEIGVLGPALFHPDGRPQRSVHAEPGLATEFLPDWILRRSPRGASVDPSRHDVEVMPWREVEAVRGAVFFIQGHVLEEVGLLDEGFFFFLEETEYCGRVRRAGFQVVYAPTLRATHGLGASSKKRAPLATRIEFHRSLYRFLHRSRGSTILVLARTARMLRNAALVAGLTLAAPFSQGLRARWFERAGLVLWHLRGCPSDPGLADGFSRRADSAADGSAGPEWKTGEA